MLTLYRTALGLRRAAAGFGGGSLEWLEAPEGVLAFTRPDGLVCVANLSGGPVPLPAHTDVVLASSALDDAGLLPQDTAVWLRT